MQELSMDHTGKRHLENTTKKIKSRTKPGVNKEKNPQNLNKVKIRTGNIDQFKKEWPGCSTCWYTKAVSATQT